VSACARVAQREGEFPRPAAESAFDLRVQSVPNAAMPRSGSMTLSDLGAQRLEVACEKCGRKGSYSVAKLYAERGEPEQTSTCANAFDRLA
jgi:hypothetical protein